METETVFPAVFIHFINVRYQVQQQRHGNHKKPTDREAIGIQPSVENSSDDNKEYEEESEGR